MVQHPRKQATEEDRDKPERVRVIAVPQGEETQPCPRCGHPMPALRGGATSICPNCGFKDACCY
jgi:transposase